MTVEANGYVVNSKSWANELYRPLSQSNDVEMNQVKLVALPYFVWGNRGLASMRVWIPKAERTG
jgi:DUF1680 family protein